LEAVNRHPARVGRPKWTESGALEG
jgi:hypothetical protein